MHTLHRWPSEPRRSRHLRLLRRRLLHRIHRGREKLVVPGRWPHFAGCGPWVRHGSFAQKPQLLFQSRQASMGPSSLLRKPSSKPRRPTSGETIVSPPPAPVGKDRRRGQPQLHRRLARLLLILELSLVLLLSSCSSRRPWRGGPYRDDESRKGRAPISNKGRNGLEVPYVVDQLFPEREKSSAGRFGRAQISSGEQQSCGSYCRRARSRTCWSRKRWVSQ